jgi:hypothetical protein
MVLVKVCFTKQQVSVCEKNKGGDYKELATVRGKKGLQIKYQISEVRQWINHWN